MDEPSTVFVAGVVQHLGRLREVVRVERVNWHATSLRPTRGQADLLVIGTAPAHVDALEVIAEVKRNHRAPGPPVLHLVPPGIECGRCEADVCLSTEIPPPTLSGVVQALCSLGRLRRGGSASRLGTETGARSGGRDDRGQLRALARVVRGIVFRYDAVARRLTFVGGAVRDLLGYTPEQLEALPPASASELVHPEDHKRLVEVGGSLARDDGVGEARCRVRTADGGWRALRARLAHVAPGGAADEILGLVVDASDTQEIRQLLDRARRLEALGRIAGGVAHDFNNALGVITGQGQLAQRLLPADHPARAGLDRVIRASERAAALPQKLLALFREPSRQPRPLDVNATVGEIRDMLERVIAEDVEIDLRLGADVGTVKAEPELLDQIVLNLAVNARDAMPRGGRLSIETTRRQLTAEEAATLEVPPGRYAMLVVSDTGTGMDAATRQHVFEPFFTTKPEGAGSGLGLATVYDGVKRCGGAIAVDSAPGSGTTFRIYLPNLGPELAAAAAVSQQAGAPAGSETVLLVEDAEPVREVTRGLLEGLGYKVLPAAHGAQAMALARAHPGPIHVLLTDVVMPKQSGGSLAAEVVSLRPEIRVLYMSGYSSDALSADGVSVRAKALLTKPFTLDRLACAVREAIDRKNEPEAC